MREHPLKNIELSHVVKMVREAAELMPRRTATCLYVKGQRKLQPACIVGHALHALGVSLEWLKENNDTDVDGLFEYRYQYLTEQERRQLAWLGDAQGAQDARKTWAKSVQRADNNWREDPI